MHWRARYAAFVRRALLGTAAAGLLLTLAAAASPQLHHLVHHGADRRDHVCLATALHAGQYETVVTAVVARAAAAPTAAPPPLRHVGRAESFFLVCRLLEHGPPLLLPS
jgi:hypothetical protein